jgi:hypothetical protein
MTIGLLNFFPPPAECGQLDAIIAALTMQVSLRPIRPDRASRSHLLDGGTPPWPQQACDIKPAGAARSSFNTKLRPELGFSRDSGIDSSVALRGDGMTEEVFNVLGLDLGLDLDIVLDPPVEPWGDCVEVKSSAFLDPGLDLTLDSVREF